MFGEHELNKMTQTKVFGIISEVTSCLNIKTNWPSIYLLPPFKGKGSNLKTEISNHPL